MLKLDHIVKVYETGGENVTALRGIDLNFRENEFVAILGHSGCGKTTLLNIIGGLDHYTSGDLIINGRSTKSFQDGDWDSYRNHSIGFVFQSYNLIPHQTVLANVELALTLSGVSKAERHRRAAEALEKVGLKDQMKKRPNQLSGGQMQRVAIARALVNNPDILLADEPTGALDSDTSVQVMDLLAEIAKDKLVIMVTHNPELADQYATRIVRLKDGEIVDDTAPFDGVEETSKRTDKVKKTSMSFFTAFGLSLNNLMTKKGRTVLTSFAGSIGIIGIALILSLSTGINEYINQVQEDTLSSYPVTIEAESLDMSSMMTSFMGTQEEKLGNEVREEDRVYSSTVMFDMMDAMMNAETSTNNLKAFKEWLDEDGNKIDELATIRYGYDVAFDIYTKDEDDNIIKSDVMTLMQEAMGTLYGGDYSSYFNTMGSMYQSMDVWEELLAGEGGELIADQVKNQYDLLYGTWPQNYDEVVLFINSRNEVSDLMLYALGYIASDDMTEVLHKMSQGETVDAQIRSWSFDELCETEFKLILPAEYYQSDAVTGGYTDMSATSAGMDYLYNSGDVGTKLKVVGIARPNEEATSSMVSGAIGYTSALTTYAIEESEKMDIVVRQMADDTVDIFTNLPFRTEDDTEPSAEEKTEKIKDYLAERSAQEKADAYIDVMSQASDAYVDGIVAQQMDGMTRESIEEMIVAQYANEMGVDAETISGYIAEMTDDQLFAQVEEAMAASVREQYAQGVAQQMGTMTIEQLAGALDLAMRGEGTQMGMTPLTQEQYTYLFDNYMPPVVSDATYEENLDRLGYVDMTSPSTISIYVSTFAEKDEIAVLIQEYNDSVDEEDEITYTDYVALLMSSITDIISGISYLLIAFVSISLVVSSIMIGVITLISVQERTKEIGILRAVGASKRDISRVFNAETMIVGFGAGLVGIVVTLILIIPINAILLHFTGLEGLKAALPVTGGVLLIAISAVLTLVAGLIPSRVAARKDPVVALRTE
ncbi:MAG: ABC transporter ATP-binding protein/permease [Oscillospiraceae bacterium]|nr:ABC transporter ATP-binding protein/permease [Oscillospiraceae bacterium]